MQPATGTVCAEKLTIIFYMGRRFVFAVNFFLEGLKILLGHKPAIVAHMQRTYGPENQTVF